MKYDAIYKSPVGKLGFRLCGSRLMQLTFLPRYIQTSTNIQQPLIQHVISELDAYFRDPFHAFDVPIATQGTPFQERIWEALLTIPPGKTMTYGEFGKQLNTSARAIGNACRTNPIPIIIPCHRIVAHNTLGGYAGSTKTPKLTIKKQLLNHEQKPQSEQ